MKLFSSVLVMLLSTQPIIANEDPNIEKLMTADEFTRAGLNALSRKQINSLNQWLISYTANEAPIIKKSSNTVKKAVKTAIESRLVGDFSGWTGKTQFFLENGQVWQQRNNKNWFSSTLTNPSVIVKKNTFGFYVLNVADIKRSIGVKRIQ